MKEEQLQELLYWLPVITKGLDWTSDLSEISATKLRSSEVDIFHWAPTLRRITTSFSTGEPNK